MSLTTMFEHLLLGDNDVLTYTTHSILSPAWNFTYLNKFYGTPYNFTYKDKWIIVKHVLVF